MVTDKKTFDERKKQIFDLCKNLEGKEDKLLLKSLFSIANYQDKFGKEGKDKIANTGFKELSDSELMSNFSKDKFTNYGDKKLSNLFQELYNRAVTKNGNDPRYVVSVKKIEEGIMGFMETYSNALEINKDLDRKSVV